MAAAAMMPGPTGGQAPPFPGGMPNLSAPPPQNVTPTMPAPTQRPPFGNSVRPAMFRFQRFQSVAQQVANTGVVPDDLVYDAKRMRKSVYRKTIDYNSAMLISLENRIWQRDIRDQVFIFLRVPIDSLLTLDSNCVLCTVIAFI